MTHEDDVEAELAAVGITVRGSSLSSNENRKKETKEPKKKSSTNNLDLTAQLKKLDELYKSGVLTKDEFDKAKKKLLN